MQQYNCQNGQSWYDVCLNTYGSLDYLGKLVSDNGGELNVQPTTNTVIYWDQSLVKDSSLLSLIKNNGYVYNTGVSLPPPYIEKFTAGVSPITFIPDGSNGWDLSVIANPTTVQIPSGETIDSVHVEVLFWDAGSDATIHDASITVDTTINTGANGAGTYEISLTYNVSDGSTFQLFAIITTDATNGIINYFKFNGTTVSGVSGLAMTVTADIDKNTSTTMEWLASDGVTPTVVGSGETANITVFANTVAVGTLFDLGSEFTDFPFTDYGVGFSISIN